ncbi:MAG: DUF2065 domain-containing protein [Methyloligellaceae bacterium]
MSDLLVAVGLVLVIEGLLWALFPSFGRKVLEALSDTPEQTLRMSGLTAITVGVVIVWLIRG